jgi:hypothetical protein
MNLMFRMSLLNLTNFINMTLIKTKCQLVNFDKFFDGYIIFNVELGIFLFLIKRCPLKYYKKVEI